MGSIAGNKYVALAVGVGNRDPQFPEALVLVIDSKGLADCLMEIAIEIKGLDCRSKRDRRMEKPAVAKIDPTEEQPIPL